MGTSGTPRHGHLRRKQAGTLSVLLVMCTAAACSASSGSPPTSPTQSGTISGRIYLGRSPEVPVPGATITFHSSSLTVATTASSAGVFTARAAPGNWTVARILPNSLAQFCANPTAVHVVSLQTSTIDIQVACASVGGGGFLARPARA